jgi:hypothetical protein
MLIFYSSEKRLLHIGRPRPSVFVDKIFKPFFLVPYINPVRQSFCLNPKDSRYDRGTQGRQVTMDVTLCRTVRHVTPAADARPHVEALIPGLDNPLSAAPS